METALSINSIQVEFPGVRALNNVSFDLAAGEVHALCGENGAGKSTLIKCISGTRPYGSYQGDIVINNEKKRFHSSKDAEQAGIAVIHQELALIREMTVAENIFLGAEPLKPSGLIDWNRLYADTKTLLAQYGLDLDPAAKTINLGIAEQQLVEIAKALSKHAKIMLLDEPSAALTESEVSILLNIIHTLKAKNVSCIYISHKLDEVFEIADRITVLRDGAAVSTQKCNETDKTTVIQQMVGRTIDTQFPRRAGKPAETILEVSDLTVNDPQTGRTVLQDIEFSVQAGEVLGIGGLMGAGRTELILHLFGYFGERVNGNIALCGKQLENHSPSDAIHHGMMLVSEDRKRYGLILEQHIGFNQSIASLRRFSNTFTLDSARENQHNRKLFESLHIKAPGLESPVATLSGGNQQKVLLAKALMTEPRLIFLDEPTRGIDVGAKLEVYELINKLTDAGKAVIMVSSEMPELIGMSDRILVLSAGKTGGLFNARQTDQQTLLQAAMAGNPA